MTHDNRIAESLASKLAAFTEGLEPEEQQLFLDRLHFLPEDDVQGYLISGQSLWGWFFSWSSPSTSTHDWGPAQAGGTDIPTN